jgi:L-ascorbate metabolism protein UlaG (beta-lactamase superfamily)
MQLIGDEGIDLAFLPIGDFFTMGTDDSIKAIRFVRPKVVIPMHYATFPPIVQDASAWANRVSSETDAQPIVIDPGNSYTMV